MGAEHQAPAVEECVKCVYDRFFFCFICRDQKTLLFVPWTRVGGLESSPRVNRELRAATLVPNKQGRNSMAPKLK